MIAGGSYIDELNLRTAYELLFFAIHFSLFVCLLSYNRRRKGPFTTGFYKLFLLQSCFIYLAFFVQLWYRYFSFNDYSAGTPGLFRYILFQFSLYLYLFTMAAIATNRLTALLVPLRHKMLWSRKRFVAIVAGLFGLALSCATIRPLRAFTLTGEDSYWTAFQHSDSVITRTTICLLLFLTNVTLEIWGFIHFYRLSAANRRRNDENFRLLLYTTLSELLELVRVTVMVSAAFHLPVNVVTTFGWWYLTYMGFVQWFSSALCLLATSKTVRHAYLQFYSVLWKAWRCARSSPVGSSVSAVTSF